MGIFFDWGYKLIVKASTDLPQDVRQALQKARDREDAGSPACSVFTTILENVGMAGKFQTPMCQDTGQVNFFISLPKTYDLEEVEKELSDAVHQATRDGFLRPNTVNSITNKNPGNNSGPGWPHFEFEYVDTDEVVVDILLKGGGSENVSAQYKLPDAGLGAGRDLKGVEKVIIDAVYKAQGKGCAPGIIGIGIGGDRAMSYMVGKKQLLRPLEDTNPEPLLAALEATLYEKLNTMGIGPMGFGGKTTVLGVKAGYAYRHPATFFVSMAYSCWAARHQRMVVGKQGVKIH